MPGVGGHEQPAGQSRSCRRAAGPRGRGGPGRPRRRWRPSAAATAAGPSRRPRRARRRCGPRGAATRGGRAPRRPPRAGSARRRRRPPRCRAGGAGRHRRAGGPRYGMVSAGSGSPSPPSGLGGQQVGGAAGDAAERGLEPHLPAVGVAPAHPVVDRGEPGVGDGDGVLGSGEPRLDQPAEVREVAAAPVRLALRPPPRRPGRRGAARRRRSPLPVAPVERRPSTSGKTTPVGSAAGAGIRAQPQTSAREGSARIAATSAR